MCYFNVSYPQPYWKSCWKQNKEKHSYFVIWNYTIISHYQLLSISHYLCLKQHEMLYFTLLVLLSKEGPSLRTQMFTYPNHLTAVPMKFSHKPEGVYIVSYTCVLKSSEWDTVDFVSITRLLRLERHSFRAV